MKLKFQIGGEFIMHEFCVVCNSTKPMILGSDFLIRIRAKIDLKNRTVAIGYNIIVLKDKLGVPDECVLAQAKSKYILPPRSVTTVTAKTKPISGENFVLTLLYTSPLL